MTSAEPMETNLPPSIPGSDQNAHVGDQGELWFAAQLPMGWVWQPPRRDLGKDGLIVIRDNSDLHNLEFSVQVKTSLRPHIQEGWVVKSGLSRSSVKYWFASPLPTLVVAVDIAAHQAWYAWHLDLFESPAAVFRSTQQTITIRIPERNSLNKEGWASIRHRLREHFGSLLGAINDANLASRLLPAINTLARNVGNLIKLAKTPPPANAALMTEHEGMSIFIEQLEHQSVLSVVRALMEYVRPDSGAAHHIRAWIEAYEATALTAFPRLNTLPARGPYGPDLEIAFAPKLVPETRDQLVAAGLDMIRLLTDDREAGRRTLERAAHDKMGTAADQSGSAMNQAPPTTSEATVKTVRLRVSDLGFSEGATTAEIIGTDNDTNENGAPAPFTGGRAGKLSLILCPTEVGPQCRLQYTDQPSGERLYVAMKPIASSDGEPRIFVLVHNDDGLSLDAVRARPDDKWQPTDVFMFSTQTRST